MHTEYELSNLELLDLFCRAAVEANVSEPSLVTNTDATPELRQYAYARGVVLARLDDVKPPARSSDVTRLKGTVGALKSNNRVGGRRPTVWKGELKTVTRARYEGGRRWSVEFFGMENFWFPAELFELASLAPTAKSLDMTA